MIGIQIITHGKMAEGIFDSVDMVLGDTENVKTNELKRGQDIDQFKERLYRLNAELIKNQSIHYHLFFGDFFGKVY